METRINKYLSESGYCSRREADRLIEQKRIKINGELALIGSKVTDQDKITVDDKPIKKQNEFVYLAFNKPIGITSTTDQAIKGNIVDYINYHKRIFHIGRLDKESEGLILMTNDGDIVNEILRTENNHEKEYVVVVNKKITQDFLTNMSKGVPILDTVTKPCVIKQTGEKTFKIILTEGLNRQIRRMCDYFGYQVVSLKRVRIMHIHLDVPTGKYRELTKKELDQLFKLIRK
ncbi:MAG: 23S rRNA pseudouridine synthase F [Tenericutes bacterium GWC2_34_14]|nr:MAG: 23S rRNA pseudouridine synthase F [Tenericutes bacterium GWA2_35_7]OHE28860.1 MAG: 23S rRNA pseudouridine synthase F [Tenericutes bacterium GWC2_34_14]OHE33327.1 MAG: 23S rRNA pseudouridine synthase F [Tenericutes bacterium GWE2_34_108]OHE36478.1 MAG: 23S rRNA pseudouridine synthase F [Tenericutes bacterium GWF1_35_14]OHE37682.1 MAG: 23S rRNA pseudouridine synthase F [Tenericutes bacterium GWF2_35_184]OHE45041.1 MAG: 23S rRNA pseudouridine synthase F [Tenericutes bacterium RIFOXYA2_FUL